MIRLFLKFSAGSWIAAAISILTTPIVTALIIPSEFGRAAMYTLALNLVVQIALLGLDISFVRKFYAETSASYQSRLLYTSFSIPILLSLIIAGGILWLGGPLSHFLIGERSGAFIILLAASIPIATFERFAMLALRMKKQAVAFSALRAGFAIINFAVILAYCSFVGASFLSIVWGTVIGTSVCALLAAILSFDLWRRFSFDKVFLPDLLRFGLPFVPAFLAAWMFEGMDRIMLRHFSTFAEIGLFTAAMKIVALLSLLHVAFSNFWLPVSFELYETRSEEAQHTFSIVFSYIAAGMFIGGFGIILFKDLIILIFDADYREAAAIMPFLLLVPMLATLSEITVGGINYKNRTEWHVVIAAGCALANFLLALALVPPLGAKGAAIATGIAYILFFYARTLISNRFFPLEINFGRVSLSVALFVGVAALNSFYPTSPFSYAAAFLSGLLVAVLNRREIKSFVDGVMTRAKPA